MFPAGVRARPRGGRGLQGSRHEHKFTELRAVLHLLVSKYAARRRKARTTGCLIGGPPERQMALPGRALGLTVSLKEMSTLKNPTIKNISHMLARLVRNLAYVVVGTTSP